MNIFTRVSSFLKNSWAPERPDPARDWLLLLITSAILLAGIVVWHAWKFDLVAGGGVIGNPSSRPKPVFSQSSLDAIRAVFENRAAEKEKYTSDVYHFADPSQ